MRGDDLGTLRAAPVASAPASRLRLDAAEPRAGARSLQRAIGTAVRTTMPRICPELASPRHVALAPSVASVVAGRGLARGPGRLTRTSPSPRLSAANPGEGVCRLPVASASTEDVSSHVLAAFTKVGAVCHGDGAPPVPALRLLLVEWGIGCSPRWTRELSVQLEPPAASNLSVPGFRRICAAPASLGRRGAR